MSTKSKQKSSKREPNAKSKAASLKTKGSERKNEKESEGKQASKKVGNMGGFPPAYGGYPTPQSGFQGGFPPPGPEAYPPPSGFPTMPPPGGFGGGYPPGPEQFPPPTAGCPPPMGYGGPPPQMGYGGPPPPMGYGDTSPVMGYGGPPPPPPMPPIMTPPAVVPSPAAMGGPMMMPGMVMMPAPPPIPGVPPGLEYISTVDCLLIKQRVEIIEILTGIETRNQYDIYNKQGQHVYFAVEESNPAARQVLGADRPFIIHICDNFRRPIMLIKRDYICCPICCCFPCCRQRVEIFAPPSDPVGRVIESCNVCDSDYEIHNAAGQRVLKIDGPCCCCRWGNVNFPVKNQQDQEVGKIGKEFGDFAKEYFSDADNFGTFFPVDLDVRMKACIIGAVFLIDFMYFESGPQNR